MTQINLSFPQSGGIVLSAKGVQGPPGGGGGGGVSSWDDLTDKPSTFPPSAHTHPISAVVDLQAALDNLQTNIDGKQDALGFTPQDTAQKGQPGGYASLDGAGLLPESQLPSVAIDVIFVDRITSLPATGETGKIYVAETESREFWWNGSTYRAIEPAPHSHAITDVTGLQSALDGKQAALGFTAENAANKDVAGGYAGLDGSGRINPAQLPAIAITERFVVNSQAAMLALTAQTGDIAIRTDISRTFILSGDPTVLANWAEVLAPTDAVTSVFGRSGVVTAQSGDYNSDQVTEGSTNLYFTEPRARGTALTGYLATGTRTALAATDTILGAFNKIGKWLGDLAAVAFSGSASDLTAGTLPAARFNDTAHGNRAGGSLHPAATTSVAGFMSSADKTKLDAITGTNTGDQASIVGISGTRAQFDAAVTDANIMYVGDAPTAHTHTTSDITGFAEAVDDRVAALVVAGANMTVTYDDVANTLTLAASGGGGGSGDVVGPASATDNAIARFDSATGKLIQNSGVTLDDNGVLNLPVASIPAAPAVGRMSMFARALGGRNMPAFIGPSGLDSFVQPHFGGNRVFQIAPTSGTGAPASIGGNPTPVGTASSQMTFGSTNRWLSTFRKRYQTSTTPGNAAGIRTAYQNWFRGSAAGFGGFYFRTQFGININLNGSQCFVGLCPATGAMANDPSLDFPLTMCGMGFDAADPNTGNWQFFRNDAVGSPVKVDLGVNAARAADTGYELVMFMAPGGSELFVQITNLNTGADVLTTSYTTDIPNTNAGMALKTDIRNGAIAAACNIEFAKIYIESDY